MIKKSFILFFFIFLLPCFSLAGSDSSSSIDNIGSDVATDILLHGGSVNTESGDLAVSGGDLNGVDSISGESGSIEVDCDVVVDADLEVDGVTELGSLDISQNAQVDSVVTSTLNGGGNDITILQNVDLSGGTLSNLDKIYITDTPTDDAHGAQKSYLDQKISDLQQYFLDNYPTK